MSISKRSFHRSAILIALLIAASSAAQQRTASDPEVQFRTAEQKVLRDGDVKGAIEIYKRITETRGVSRAVAARAWLAMGQVVTVPAGIMPCRNGIFIELATAVRCGDSVRTAPDGRRRDSTADTWLKPFVPAPW